MEARLRAPAQSPRYPLEPSADEMRSMGRAALEFLIHFIEDLPDSPAMDLHEFDGVVAAARRPPSEDGGSFDSILDLVGAGASKAFNTTGPGYLPYIPGGGLFASALADFLACGVNRYVNVWNAAPSFAQIESTVLRWMCDLFDFPLEAGGILTSGGSMANFSAIVTARHALLGEDFLDGTIYVSDQAHASVAKAAVLAGFPHRSIRIIKTDPEDLALDLHRLGAAIAEDRAEGRRPFLVVGSAGTTNTGRVDTLPQIAALAADQGLWFHVDAAYGGFFQLTDRGRLAFRGIESADSITLDPHKGMFLPYGTGCLLVRDSSKLRAAHQVGAHYLQDLAAEADIPNFADYSPELSRDFRGLRVWLPLMLYGVGAFRDALDEKLDLTRYLDAELRATPGFELRWEPDLSVVAFTRAFPGGDQDEMNRRLLDRVNASRRVMLSSTMIHGRYVIRACILSFRTHRDRIEEAVEIIRSAAADLVR